MSPRTTKNDRTITLTFEALEVYNKWGHEKSKKVSQAIIKFDDAKPFTEEQENRINELIKQFMVEDKRVYK
jgi:hypothetical protein